RKRIHRDQRDPQGIRATTDRARTIHRAAGEPAIREAAARACARGGKVDFRTSEATLRRKRPATARRSRGAQQAATARRLPPHSRSRRRCDGRSSTPPLRGAGARPRSPPHRRGSRRARCSGRPDRGHVRRTDHRRVFVSQCRSRHSGAANGRKPRRLRLHKGRSQRNAPLVVLAGRVHVVRRVGGAHATVYRIVALVLGLAIGTALAQSYVEGTNVYDTIYRATVGSAYGATAVLAYAAPLTLTALAFAVCFKLRLWNLGAEGQLFMGAWAATGIAFTFPGIPGPLLIALMIVASAIAGAIWVLLPALARVYLGVTEVVTTLMLNFVAILWITYFAFHVWPAPGTPLATTADLPER